MTYIKKPSGLAVYQIISAAFCIIVVFSNIISVKMVKLPFFLNCVIPAGLLFYPFTFLLSDLITEIFGSNKAKRMVYIAFAMNLLSFGIIQLALILPTYEGNQEAFQSVLGLSGLRIFSSLIAYLLSQIVDIQLYTFIKNWTGPRFLWLRNNGSTCLAQIVDTIVIDIIYLFWGLGMSWAEVLPVMLFSYLYKVFFSIINTPLLYFTVFLFRAKWKSPSEISKNNLGVVYE